MLCHFQGGSRRHPPPRPPAAVTEPEADSPLAPVLARLIGREVAVLAGDRIHAGRLIAVAPVTLVGPGGQVTVLAQPASSVQF